MEKQKNNQSIELDAKVERISTEEIEKTDMSSPVPTGLVKPNADFDIFYAEAWSKKQGHFSFKLANNLINYLKSNKINIKSVLDVCSGSGEFLSVMRNICTKCVGIDTYEGYLQYVRSNYSDIEFYKVDGFDKFKLKDKFDLISCNRDVVNMFERFEQWEDCFKTIHAHLNMGGFFVFDFYTEEKLKNWNTTIYEQSDDIDYVSKIYHQHGKCVFNEVYYLKQSTSYYRKTSDIMVESYYPTDDIIKALEKAGFKNISLVNIDLEPITDIAGAGRIHVLATK